MIEYWTWFGLVYLLWMTYTDVFRGNVVDGRKNAFMMALSISLYSHVQARVWYVFLVVGLIVGISILMERTRLFSKGDTNAFRWLLVGFVILNLAFSGIAFVFFLSLVVYTALWVGVIHLYKRRMNISYTVRTAYFPVLLGSFVTTALIFGIFRKVYIVV